MNRVMTFYEGLFINDVTLYRGGPDFLKAFFIAQLKCSAKNISHKNLPERP